MPGENSFVQVAAVASPHRKKEQSKTLAAFTYKLLRLAPTNCECITQVFQGINGDFVRPGGPYVLTRDAKTARIQPDHFVPNAQVSTDPCIAPKNQASARDFNAPTKVTAPNHL